jgi:hypothetical protein
MQLLGRRSKLTARLGLGAALAGVVASAFVGSASRVAAQVASPALSIPARIADDVFWRMITEFSEPGGYFRSDNFVSNETTFQYVIPELKKTTPKAGVYVGVGPDQNFTYLVAMQPKIAFIVDIRRQNMLQHLMYKALLETSADRAEFLSRLFSRTRPAGLDSTSTAEVLLERFGNAAMDSLAYLKNLKAIKDQLTVRHKFALSADDLKSIEYVYSAFYRGGPELTYSFANPPRGSFGGRRMPTYAELMIENDGHGQNRSYMASEENYRTLAELEKNNLVVPLVGNFAGDQALRLVGKYVRERGATVTAFYTSNVEQYLFQQDDDWKKFFTNVAALPVDSSSVFIRAVFNNMGFRDPGTPMAPRSETLLCPIGGLIAAFNAGKIQSYWDAIQCGAK